MNAGDDINSPYDGMKAIATDGTIYTYNAQINGWLMPEVTVLEEQGFIPNFFNLPDFDGGIISTMTVIALTEPSPIGEIVVGVTVIYLYAYYGSDAFAYDWDEDIFTSCVQKYVRCYVPNCTDCCADCLEACKKGRGWDEIKCTLSNY